jgi:hypothetical protein
MKGQNTAAANRPRGHARAAHEQPGSAIAKPPSQAAAGKHYELSQLRRRAAAFG